MRINSKDCVRAKCNLYPCKRKSCNYKLAFDDNGNWFVAMGNELKYLLQREKRERYNEDRITKVNF